MSKTIFEAAKACQEAILRRDEEVNVTVTSRIYPHTGSYYVQAHARLTNGMYIVAFLWEGDKEVGTFRFDTLEEMQSYMQRLYTMHD